MTTIIRDRYPVKKLPKDLRDAVSGSKVVRLTIEAEESPKETRSLEDLLAETRKLHEEGKIQPVTTEEAVARIRALRDEWDD